MIKFINKALVKIEKNRKGRFGWLSIAVLSFLMLIYINFFTISINNNSMISTIASFIWSGFVFVIFFMILYTGNIGKYRSIFFICFAFVFFPAFMQNLIVERGSFQISQSTIINSETPYCHIVITMTLIPYIFTKTVNFPAQLKNHYASVYSMLIIWLVSSIFIGKGWCSWVCFYGGFDEFFSKLGRKKILKIDSKNELIRYFNFVILFFVIFATFVAIGPVYCEWLCPFKLVTEFSAIYDIKSYVQTIFFIVLFFGLVVVLPFLTKKRFQCMSFCPFGAMQSLIDKISLYKVKIDTEKCIKCKRCISVCPINALHDLIIDNEKETPEITCNKCGNCISICPVKAISYDFRGIKNIKKQKNIIRPIEKIVKNQYVNKLLFYFVKSIKEILSPQALFIFSAMVFGLIISSGFAVSTIKMLLSILFK